MQHLDCIKKVDRLWTKIAQNGQIITIVSPEGTNKSVQIHWAHSSFEVIKKIGVYVAKNSKHSHFDNCQSRGYKQKVSKFTGAIEALKSHLKSHKEIGFWQFIIKNSQKQPL